MTSLSCCIDFHDDLMYGLGFMDRVELFDVNSLSAMDGHDRPLKN